MMRTRFETNGQRDPRRARGCRPLGQFAMIGAALCAALAVEPGGSTALGCGGTPPPPVCGKTIVFGKAAPPVVFFPGGGGGVIFVPTSIFLALPPGVPPCPPPPYMATVTLTFVCFPGPGAFGAVGPIPIVPGFNPILVPVAIPAGPPRICFVNGTATVAFTDGTSLSRGGDTTVCISEPSPTDPSLPRLDLVRLSPEIHHVHPGDQAVMRYRLTNNDGLNSWTGTVTGAMENSAGMPTLLGPGSLPFTGPYAVSDPGPGDNFPICWGDHVGGTGCLLLPPLPIAVPPTQIVRTITLAPSAVRDIDIVARPWGQCANGSCGESTIVADGSFSDGDPGIACTGAVVVVDTSAPSMYQWPDAGRAVLCSPPFPGAPLLDIFGNPTPAITDSWQAGAVLEGTQLLRNGVPVPSNTNVQGVSLDQNYGRLKAQHQVLGPPIQATRMITVLSHIELFPVSPPPLQIQMLLLEVVPGAPTGFANRSPIGKGFAGIDKNGDFMIDSFFDVFYQVNGLANDAGGNTIPIEIVSLSLTSAGSGFDIRIDATIPGALPTSPPIVGLQIMHDMRGFARKGVPCPGDINGDGVVGFADLTLVLLSWGPCGIGCPADQNQDGVVGFNDITVVLLNWGPC